MNPLDLIKAANNNISLNRVPVELEIDESNKVTLYLHAIDVFNIQDEAFKARVKLIEEYTKKYSDESAKKEAGRKADTELTYSIIPSYLRNVDGEFIFKEPKDKLELEKFLMANGKETKKITDAWIQVTRIVSGIEVKN